jgi:hypothetical protein
MLGYTVVVWIICDLLGHPQDFNAGLYTAPVLALDCLFGVCVFLVLLLRHCLGSSERPIFWFRKTLSPREFLRRLDSALPVLLALPFFLTAFTGAKNLLNEMLPFAWDAALEALSRRLEFGYDIGGLPSIQVPAITRFIELVYASWGLLFLGIPCLIALRPVGCALRMRFFTSYALILVLLGNLVAGLFMSAGPFWLEYNHIGHSGFSPLFSYLHRVDPGGEFSATQFQHYLIAAHLKGLTYLGTGISAFPSIHVAIATLFVLVAWRFGWLLRALSLAFLAIIFVGSVELGWHYPVDGYASIILTAAIYRAVGWLQRRLDRRVEALPASPPPRSSPAA